MRAAGGCPGAVPGISVPGIPLSGIPVSRPATLVPARVTGSSFLPSQVLPGRMEIKCNSPPLSLLRFRQPPAAPREAGRGTGDRQPCRAAKQRSPVGAEGSPAPAGRSPRGSGDTEAAGGGERSPPREEGCKAAGPAARPRPASILLQRHREPQARPPQAPAPNPPAPPAPGAPHPCGGRR